MSYDSRRTRRAVVGVRVGRSFVSVIPGYSPGMAYGEFAALRLSEPAEALRPSRTSTSMEAIERDKHSKRGVGRT
jgi:hypothetical protein